MNRRDFFKGIAAAGAAAMLPFALIPKDRPLGFVPKDLRGRKGGFKGESHMDSGYFYVPYKPVRRNMPAMLDPCSAYTPRKGVLTRYSKKTLREGARYYRKISLKDLLK